MATLTMDLDDQASTGLTSIEHLIDQLGHASADASKGADKLSAAQDRGIVVTQRQDVSFKKLADTGIQTFGDIGTAGIRAFVELETASTRAVVEVANNAIKVAGSVAKVAIVSGAAAYTAIKIFGEKHKKTMGDAEEDQRSFGEALKGSAAKLLFIGAPVATLGAQYGLMGKAAEVAAGTAIKAMLGIGPYALGATIAIKGMETVWKNTGLRMVELDDGTKKMESNWDRIGAAGNKMGQSVKRDLGEAGQAIKSMMDIQIQWPDLWTEIDMRATRAADNLTKNIGTVNKVYDEAGVYFRHYVLGLSATVEAERDATNSSRELNASIEALAKKLESQRDGWRLLKEANQDMAKSEANRAEAQRIASIKTTWGMDAEIAKVRDRAKAIIEAGKFDEDMQKAYTATITALTNQRINVAKQEAADRAKGHGAFMAYSDEELKAIDARMKKSRELFDLETKHQSEFANLQKGLQNTQKKQNQDTDLAAAKEQHAAQKDFVSERLKAQGASEAQVKIQLAEMDKQFSAAEHKLKTTQIEDEARDKLKSIMDQREEVERTVSDENEKRKALIKLQMEEEKARADRIKKQLEENGAFERQQAKLSADQRLTAQKDLFAAERERIQKAKALEDQAANRFKDQFDASGFRDQQDPAKVRKQFIKDQQDKAANDQMAKDKDLGDRGLNGDQQAARQWIENQKRAAQRAKRQATDAFDNGTADPNQVDQSAGKVAQQTVSNFQSQGQINANQSQILTSALQALNDQQTASNAILNVQANLINYVKGQKNVAQKQATTAQNLQGTLGQ